MVEKGFEMAAAMYDAKDKHFLLFNTVNVALSDVPSAGHGKFSEKARASAFLHFLGKLLHGFLCDTVSLQLPNGASAELRGAVDV